MKKIFVLNLLLTSFAFIFSVSLNAQNTEVITMTTYYPSPYGVYKTLRLFPTNDINPTAACPTTGEIYYDQSDNVVYICDGSTSTWQPVGESFWTQPSGTSNLHSRDAGWNVGIGTANPRVKLEVNDTLLITPRASDPATTTEGAFYYNNSASVKGFKYYDGSIWRTFGNADLYVRNASGVAQKKNSPKILLGSVSGLTTGAWNTVSWTNTPFTNIYAVLLTPSDGGGYEFDARTNGTTNSVQIQPDSNGMTITFLVIGD